MWLRKQGRALTAATTYVCVTFGALRILWNPVTVIIYLRRKNRLQGGKIELKLVSSGLARGAPSRFIFPPVPVKRFFLQSRL